MNAPGRGFSMAASSLVGQELGRNDEQKADDYGKDLLRFSSVVYTALAVFVIVFAPQISTLFADDPETISQVVPFVRVAAVSALGYGLSETWTGVLKATKNNN
jgi:Na+-driven multidrug efflux pump